MIWEEDFSSAILDKETWKYDVSNGFYDKGKFVYGWGNSELQYYRGTKTEEHTNENLFIEDGLDKNPTNPSSKSISEKSLTIHQPE